MKALIISADNFEDLELLVPYYRLKEANIEVDVASINHGGIKGERGYEVSVNKSIDEVDPEIYDFLILPGGKAPEALRKHKKVLEIAKHFFKQNKIIGAICHGPQILITAGLLKGKKATCYKSVRKEMEEALANYEDTEVVVDGNLITSRQPSDLPYFLRALFKKIKA